MRNDRNRSLPLYTLRDTFKQLPVETIIITMKNDGEKKRARGINCHIHQQLHAQTWEEKKIFQAGNSNVTVRESFCSGSKEIRTELEMIFHPFAFNWKVKKRNKKKCRNQLHLFLFFSKRDSLPTQLELFQQHNKKNTK